MTVPLPPDDEVVAEVIYAARWVTPEDRRGAARAILAALRARQAERGEVTVRADDLRAVLLNSTGYDGAERAEARLRAALPAGGAISLEIPTGHRATVLREWWSQAKQGSPLTDQHYLPAENETRRT